MQGALGNFDSAIADLTEAIRLDPTNQWHYYCRAKLYGGTGDRDSALADWGKLLRLDPTVAEAYYERAGILRAKGEYSKALADFNEAIRLNPKPWYYYRYRGEAYLQLGEDEKARRDFDQAIALEPKRWYLYKRRAESHFHLKHYDEALADFDKALELNPDDLSTLTWIPLEDVAACPDEGFRQGILALADKAVEINEGIPEASSIRGRLYTHMGKLDTAIGDLTSALERFPHDPNVHYQLGVAQFRAGNWRSAKRRLEESMERGGGNARTCFFLAMTEWKLAEHERARKWFRAADLYRRKYMQDAEDVGILHAEAAALLGLPTRPQGDVEPSEEKLLEMNTLMLELKPDGWWARLRRGRAYARVGDWAQAASDFTKAIELGADEYSFYFWHARAMTRLALADYETYRKECSQMLEQFGDTEDSEAAHWVAWTCALVPDAVADLSRPVALAERALESDRKSADRLTDYGAILYRAGQLERALQQLSEADRQMVNPNSMSRKSPAYIWFFLAMTHQRLGHEEEARTWLDKAVAWTEKVTREHADGNGRQLPWNRRLTLRLLREEAEAMLKPADAEEQSGPSRDENETSVERDDTKASRRSLPIGTRLG